MGVAMGINLSVARDISFWGPGVGLFQGFLRPFLEPEPCRLLSGQDPQRPFPIPPSPCRHDRVSKVVFPALDPDSYRCGLLSPPRGFVDDDLGGLDPPVEARVVAVADADEAMAPVAEHVLRPPLTRAECRDDAPGVGRTLVAGRPIFGFGVWMARAIGGILHAPSSGLLTPRPPVLRTCV